MIPDRRGNRKSKSRASCACICGGKRVRKSKFPLRVVIPGLLVPILLLLAVITVLLGKISLTAHAADENGDWTYVEHDFSGTRYSPLTQITPKNVSSLAKVCSYTFPEAVPSESAPIVLAGIVYLTSQHYTVALDGSDCRVLWSYQWVPRDRE